MVSEVRQDWDGDMTAAELDPETTLMAKELVVLPAWRRHQWQQSRGYSTRSMGYGWVGHHVSDDGAHTAQEHLRRTQESPGRPCTTSADSQLGDRATNYAAPRI